MLHVLVYNNVTTEKLTVNKDQKGKGKKEI